MFEFQLPDLGEGIAEGQIVSIMIKEGDRVEEYQDIMEVETDKAAVPIPSPRAGVVKKISVKEGQVVKVGEVLIAIDDAGDNGDGKVGQTRAEQPGETADGEAAPARSGKAARAEASSGHAGAAAHGREEVRARAGEPVEGGRVTGGGRTSGGDRATAVAAPPAQRGSGPVPAAPVVRKLAREMGVDINAVSGSGPGGRILREDVERFSMGHRGSSSRFVEAGAAGGDGGTHGGGASVGEIPIPGGDLPDFSQWGPVRREPAPQIRKTIARQMTRAWLNVPRVTHNDQADITEMENNRKRLNAGPREGQTKLTLTAIVIKAVAMALRDYPRLNCSYDPAGGEIIFKDYVHIGIAVDTPRGLVVPVVRDVDKRSLPDVAAALHDVANRARDAKFEIAELRGATFTVTNVGALGGTSSTPMVNYPEVAILGLGKAALQPAVVDGQIVPRRILSLSLSFDHRVVDGADAARFTRDVIDSLENPLRLISFG